MRYLIISASLILSFLLPTSFAKETYDGSGGAVDHNIGGVLRLDIFGNDAKIYTPGGGISANLEILATASDNKKKHIYIFDSNLKLAMGTSNGENPDFFLKLRGNITTGFQAYSIVPLTLAFEDGELDVTGGGVKQTYLFGTAILVPIGQLFKVNTNERQMVLTTTLGTRYNSMGAHNESPWPAMQIKIRFLDSNKTPTADGLTFSAFSTLLFDLSKSKSLDEKKGSVGFAVNNLVGLGTQVGLEGSYTKLKVSNTNNDFGSFILFVGGDLL